MKTIKIVNVPDGTAPYRIREQWVGVDIPLETLNEKERNNHFGNVSYIVLSTEALKALRVQNKTQAADFWSSCVLGKYIAFKRTDCIENHKCIYTENSRPYCAECGHLIGGF